MLWMDSLLYDWRLEMEKIKLLREHIMLWDRTLSSNNGYNLRANVDLSFVKPKWRGPFFHNCSLHLHGFLNHWKFDTSDGCYICYEPGSPRMWGRCRFRQCWFGLWNCYEHRKVDIFEESGENLVWWIQLSVVWFEMPLRVRNNPKWSWASIRTQATHRWKELNLRVKINLLSRDSWLDNVID